MELTNTQCEYREWLIGLILSAKSLAEIAGTRQKLTEWVQEHPDDEGIMDGFDHLAMSQLLAASREAEQKQAA